MIHFIAQLRICYDGHPFSQDHYEKTSDLLCTHLSEILKSLGLEVEVDTERSQPEGHFERTNTYVCVDVIVAHRVVNHLRSVSTFSKLVEGYAEYLGVSYDVDITVGYLDERPRLARLQ